MDPVDHSRQEGLFFLPGQYDQMLAWVEQGLPEEACGLLEGKSRRVTRVIPVENILHSPVRFSMSPQEQVRAFQEMEERSTDLLGFFHSHPHGPARPSATDISEFYYPGTVSVIWSHNQDGWQVHGFWIDGNVVKEVPLTF